MEANSTQLRPALVTWTRSPDRRFDVVEGFFFVALPMSLLLWAGLVYAALATF